MHLSQSLLGSLPWFILLLAVFPSILPSHAVLTISSSDATTSNSGQRKSDKNCPFLPVINDGFCDCLDGSDEPDTEACSYVPYSKPLRSSSLSLASRSFTCNYSRKFDDDNTHHDIGLNHRIPHSRMNDGVCDCCDGSDEENMIHAGLISCNNTCDIQLQALQQEAMDWYVNVRAGLQNKVTMTNKVKRSKSVDEQAMKRTKLDYEWLHKKLRYSRQMLRVEARDESLIQVYILRDRMSNCSYGLQEACDYFGENVPEGVASTTVAWALHSEHVTSYSKELLDERKKRILHHRQLPTREKVNAVFCPQPEIIRASLKFRSFENFGEYYKFMTGKYAGAYRKNMERRNKDHKTLFGPFLNNDNVDEGYRMGKIFLAEMMGFALMPISLSSKLLYKFSVQAVKSYIWKQVVNCYDDIDDCVLQGDIVKYLVREIVDFQDDQRETIFDVLNYRRYSLAIYFADILRPILLGPMWVFHIAWEAPMVYFQYYFTDAGDSLPQMQSSCLLRATIDVIKDELEKMEEKMVVKRGYITNDLYSAGEKARKRRYNSEDDSWAPVTNKIDYGLFSDWMALENKCINRTFPPYTYTLCFFKYIEQDGTLIGRYNGWGRRDSSILSKTIHSKEDTQSSVSKAFNKVIDLFVPEMSAESDSKLSAYDSQMYVDGQTCANGIIRSADVLYKCGRESIIDSVTEIDVCNYLLEVSTPIACSHEMVEAAYNRLTNLEVFGMGNKNDDVLAKAWQASASFISETVEDTDAPSDMNTKSEVEESLLQPTLTSSPDIFGNEEVIEL